MIVGDLVGPYRVLAKLGEGGMGEVYRARDTTLDRDVALKILPESFASDPERVMRFEREAKTLASLNHPHIAQVHGFEHEAGTHALVMELVDGDDLAQRIARGAIPLEDALPIARQIAEALEAAHEAGIIHRDLKPANIKVRPDGTVKVLDFGLAKAVASGASRASGASGASGRSGASGATITSPAMTMQGMILGTAAYMSPEQAKGKPADKRSDIWAFGCVLYEMLTGARAFEGEDITDTIVAVMSREPDWTRLPVATPPSLRRLLRRTLDKKASHRLPDIGVARLEIDEALSGGADDAIARNVDAGVAASGRRWSVAAICALAGVVIGAAAATLARRGDESPPVSETAIKLDAKVGDAVSIRLSGPDTAMGATVILSPDGKTLAFVGRRGGDTHQLYVRRLDELQATPLSGTDGARGPFFSPDGRWLAFFADGKLKKVAITGGASLALADAPDSRGGTWSDDDTIIFARSPLSVLSRVSSAGGAVTPVTRLGDGEVTHRWPHVLPGSKALLYEAHSSRTGHESGTIVVQSLPTGERKVLYRGGYDPRYLHSGHLAFVHEGTLFVAPFDRDRLELAAAPIPALPGVSGNIASGWAQFSVATTGTLVYLPGESMDGLTAPIDMVDPTGQSTPLRSTRSNWAAPAFSPDGRHLAIMVLQGNETNIWLYDLIRESMTPFTTDGAIRPIWTPDGKRITFTRNPGGVGQIFWKPADSSAEAHRLSDGTNGRYAGSWHPSGKFLAVVENVPPDNHIVIYSLFDADSSNARLSEPVPFATGGAPAFSPDGRWLAYGSPESGRLEVYVRPFPGPGGKWPISTDGGQNPSWSRTSSEVLFMSPDRQLMATPYSVNGNEFRADKPRPWTKSRIALPFFNATPYALYPDGKRAVFARAGDADTQQSQDTAVFVVNFFDELRRLTPSKPVQ